MPLYDLSRELLQKVHRMPTPNHENSRIISLRLSNAVIDRLNRYLDWMDVHHQQKLSRSKVMRQSLSQWLTNAEEQGGMTHPSVLRSQFYSAYRSLQGRGMGVEIRRLRRLLNWSPDRFDRVLESLRAESKVALEIGDASELSEDERQRSYEVNGQLYLILYWLD